MSEETPTPISPSAEPPVPAEEQPPPADGVAAPAPSPAASPGTDPEGQPLEGDATAGDGGEAEATSTPWELVKAAVAILRSPLQACPRVASELSPSAAALLGTGCCLLMALCYPLTRAEREDVLDALARYGFDVLILLGALAVFAGTIHLLRRFAFEQDDAHLGQSIYLVGCFALLVGVAGLGAGLLQLAHLGFLAPLLLGAAKVAGICTLYSAMPAVAGTPERGTFLALAVAASLANLVSSLELGMGRLF